MQNVSTLNTLRYDSGKCIGCGLCAAVCPHAVFVMAGRVAQVARAEACMECGACQLNCPVGALAVESGVGCAAAMFQAALTGRREVVCGESEAPAACCG